VRESARSLTLPADRVTLEARREPSPWWGGAAAVLPGILAGAHLAGLLFFLNPELPFLFAPLARGVLAYGSILGGASLLAHLPWLWRSRRGPSRFLPWSLATVLLGFAVLDAAHASFYAYYLPSGINVRLL
jgi:hypothetical protein